MLNREARAELLIVAVGLTLHELAPDCLSSARLGVSDEFSVVVQWHTDGVHEPTCLPRVWLPMDSVLADPRGIEELAEEVVVPEVRRHLLEDHQRRT